MAIGRGGLGGSAELIFMKYIIIWCSALGLGTVWMLRPRLVRLCCLDYCLLCHAVKLE